MEGNHAASTGELISLSEQQLNDCSWDYGNHGCNGGLQDWAFDYAAWVTIESEGSYPYTGRDDECKETTDGVVKVWAYDKIHPDGPSHQEALSLGPVAVSVKAN